MNARYGQLSYTSFDNAGRGGGWQVKQSAGELTDGETELLVAGVRTVFRPAEPLPDYPSPQQLEAAPRRLAYRRGADGAGAYWHTVPAGVDATGRPGNVFAHTVLDRAPDTTPRLRPVQRWRAPGWLLPYGPAAVAAAMLTADVPGDGLVVTKDSVISFVLDAATWRIGTLLGLLDAVAAALDGGAPVVLAAESVDTAAQWIGLVSFFMSPGTASALNFSTFERADDVATELGAGQHLSAVPLADLAALPAGPIVIDETALLSLGELGGQPHRTSTGQDIEVTAWSVLAQEALLDARSARRLLDGIEGYAAQTLDRGLAPAWPLAAAIAADPALTETHPEARDVIAAHTPDDVVPDSPAAHLVRDIFAEAVGHSTADAWDAVERDLGDALGRYALKTYLLRALADEAWLDRSGPVPVGSRSYRCRPLPADLAAAIGPALDRARSGGPQRVLKLADLLIRAGIDDDRIGKTLDDTVTAEFADPETGPLLTAQLEHCLCAATRIAVAASVLPRTALPDGWTSISPAVLEWFADGVGMPAPADLAAAQRWDATWTSAAVRGLRAQQHGRNGESSAEDRFAQLWWLAACGSPRRDELAGSQIWDPGQLVAAGGATLSPAAILPTLVGAPDSAALTGLCDDVIAANSDDSTVAVSMVRRVDPGSWIQHGYLGTHLPGYVGQWDHVLAGIPPARVHPDFGVRLVVLAAVAAGAGLPRPSSADRLAADEPMVATAGREVVALVERHLIAPTAVLAAGLLGVSGAGDQNPGHGPAGVDAVLAAAADALTAAGQLGEHDEDALVEWMMQLSGEDPQGPARRQYRKLAQKTLDRRGGAQPLSAAWISRGN